MFGFSCSVASPRPLTTSTPFVTKAHVGVTEVLVGTTDPAVGDFHPCFGWFESARLVGDEFEVASGDVF